jgi:hypothetical protein
MPLHLTVDRAAEVVAGKWLKYQDTQMSVARRTQIMPATKYNLLVTAFNASTVLLTIAIAAAILFSHTTAFVFGAIALFVRFTTEKEIRSKAIPREGAASHLQQLAHVALNAMGLGQRNVGHTILTNVAAEQDERWNENEVILLDYPVWKNRVPLPPDPDRPRGRAEPAAAEQPAG